MRVKFLKRPKADVIAKEDASDGEFYVRQDGSVWYRNELAPGDDWFVNASRADFDRAVDMLHRYTDDVLKTEEEDEQLVCVRWFESQLRALGFLPRRSKSFWRSIVEQAHHGMQ